MRTYSVGAMYTIWVMVTIKAQTSNCAVLVLPKSIQIKKNYKSYKDLRVWSGFSLPNFVLLPNISIYYYFVLTVFIWIYPYVYDFSHLPFRVALQTSLEIIFLL